MSYYPSPTPVNLDKEETVEMGRLEMLTELAIEDAEKAESAGKEIKTLLSSIKNGYFQTADQLLEPLQHILVTMGESH